MNRTAKDLARPAATVLAVALTALAATAQDPDVLRRIDRLERELATLKEQGAPAADTAPARRYPDVHVTGFFHLDAGTYLQDSNSRATLGDIDDAAGFRRARLAAAGHVDDGVSFVVEFDAAQAQPRFVDVWAQLDHTPLGALRIGRYRQPFGMDELTSVRNLPFLERSTSFAFAPFRQTGVQLTDTAFDERATWAVSGYRFSSDNYGNVYSDTGGYGVAVRVTGLLREDGPVHVGAGYSHNTPDNKSARFLSQNEFFGGDNPMAGASGLDPAMLRAVPAFVDTGVLTANQIDLFDVEAAAAFGPLTLQAEARLARVDQGSSSQTFTGGYAQARWLLTGETLPYQKKSGVFGRVQPANPLDAGGLGAVELAARISRIDLDDVASGRMLTLTTLGVNWYMTAHTKLQCDWIHGELGDRAFGDSSSDTFALRMQVDF